MTTNERTLNSYALRNALLLSVYGIYGILCAPRLFTLFEDPNEGGIGWVVRIVVLVLYICYLFLGMTAMLTHQKIKSNHHLINILFFVIFLDCLFLGFYLTSSHGLETPPVAALSLSSMIIAAVMIYYFVLFQIKGQEIKALRTMTATLLFFSGGGEIFFHHIQYVNTIMGWFMIWMALNGPDRPLWKSFVMSLVGSFLFFVPRWGAKGATFLDMLNTALVEKEVPPLYFIYIYAALVLVIVIIILRIKIKTLPDDTMNSASVDNSGE